VAAVHAFSLWTWHATGGKLMVVDVQVVVISGLFTEREITDTGKLKDS